jgi:ankyrin repeat protein
MSRDLHRAAREGDLVTLAAAIGEGIDLEVRDRSSRTPLHLAAWAGHADAVKALLAAGVKVNAGAQDELSALHFAAQKGHSEVIRVLLDGGAKPNSKTRRGANALMMAASHGHKDAVKVLLERNADVNAKNKKGQTAAELCKDPETLELLNSAQRNAVPVVNVPIVEKRQAPVERKESLNEIKNEEGSDRRPSKMPRVLINYDDDD